MMSPRSNPSIPRVLLVLVPLGLAVACGPEPVEEPAPRVDVAEADAQARQEGGEEGEDGESGENDGDVAYDLVFLSGRSGSNQLYRLNPESGELTTLTDLPPGVFGPRWVPERQSLTFATEGDENLSAGLYELRLGSSSPEEAAPTFLRENPAGDEVPEWVDGQRLLYSAVRAGNRDVFLLLLHDDPEGEEPVRLTEHPAEDLQPRWSPEDNAVLFVSRRDGNQEVYRLDLATRELINLTSHPSLEGHPEWAPEGAGILFYRYDEGDADLYNLSLRPGEEDTGDGTVQPGEAVNLTASEGNELVGRYSPDGRWIVFSSERTGDWELFRMRPDGTEVEQLTESEGFDGDPVWVPRGTFGEGG
ncbi:MAG: hypothetical protein SX243_09730 [Acidobacteriota bacterium]|nr:hypothetical protein [Acidobacteriota bacterium]